MEYAEYLRRLPKVELHCHVEGCVRPQTVLELARKAGRTLAVEDPTELYRYTSLDSFLAIFWLVQGTLVEPADWERIAYESLVDAAPHGLRYREMFFTPARHLAAGQTLASIIDGLSAGIEAAEADTRVHCMLIADMDRAYEPAAGRELVEQLAELRHQRRAERVIGIGMDSTEVGVDPGVLRRAVRTRATSRVPPYRSRRRGGRRGTPEHPDRPRRAWAGAYRPCDRGHGGPGARPTHGGRPRPIDSLPQQQRGHRQSVPEPPRAPLPGDARGGTARHAQYR